MSASGLDVHRLWIRWLTPPAGILSGSALEEVLSGRMLTGSPNLPARIFEHIGPLSECTANVHDGIPSCRASDPRNHFTTVRLVDVKSQCDLMLGHCQVTHEERNNISQ